MQGMGLGGGGRVVESSGWPGRADPRAIRDARQACGPVDPNSLAVVSPTKLIPSWDTSGGGPEGGAEAKAWIRLDTVLASLVWSSRLETDISRAQIDFLNSEIRLN